MTSSAPNPRLQAALEYAQRGWPVVPVWWPSENNSALCACPASKCESTGKHPMVETVPGTRHKRAIAPSIDPEVISAWWQKWPMANVGLRTNTFNVCDIDLPNLDAIRAKSPEAASVLSHLPKDAPVVKSGGGKWHYYLAHIEEALNIEIFPNVDWRTTGGLIIAPPSRHESGRLYQWHRPPMGSLLPQAPEAIRNIFARRKQQQTALREYSGAALSPAMRTAYGQIRLEDRLNQLAAFPHEPSGRNNALNSLAVSCFSLVPGGWISSALIRHEFTKVALRIGLSEKEIRSTLASAERFGLAHPNGPKERMLTAEQRLLLYKVSRGAVVQEREVSGRWHYRDTEGELPNSKLAAVSELRSYGLARSVSASNSKAIWETTDTGQVALLTGAVPPKALTRGIG